MSLSHTVFVKQILFVFLLTEKRPRISHIECDNCTKLWRLVGALTKLTDKKTPLKKDQFEIKFALYFSMAHRLQIACNTKCSRTARILRTSGNNGSKRLDTFLSIFETPHARHRRVWHISGKKSWLTKLSTGVQSQLLSIKQDS